MKKLVMLVCVLCLCAAGVANASTTFLGGDLLNAANWDKGLPAGQEAAISVDGYYGTNITNSNAWLNGSTATIDGGATLTLNVDFSASGAVLVTVNDATINCTDDFFVQNSNVVLNAGSVVTCADDWEANDDSGRITVNGGSHASGTGTGNNVGAQGSSTKIGCGIDFRGSTVTAGNFRFQINSTSSVGGSAILMSHSPSTTFSDMSGEIDIRSDWTGYWEVGSFGDGDWQAALTGGGNFTLDGAVIDATSFAANFVVSDNGTTLSFLNRVATSPDPANGEAMVEVDLADRTVAGELSWTAPVAYTGATYDVYLGTTEPNLLGPAPYGLTKQNATSQSATSISPSLTLVNDQTYYWVVDSYEPNTVPVLHQGVAWSFVAAPSDYFPIVTAGNSYITWVENLPQTVDAIVDDSDEGDIAAVAWEVISGPGYAIAEDMQMLDRAADIDNITGDPNLLRDWIGTDSRGADEANSDVLILTLSGLPAGTYSWTSYHYDAENQGDVFDVIVNDAAGSTTTTGVVQTSGAVAPATFTTSIVSDGSDVTLAFVASDEYLGMFAMNGFELTGSGDPLMIDFSVDQEDPASDFIMPGYQGYLAEHEVPETFTTQSFEAFGTTVSITPSWDAPGAAISSTGGTLLAPTATP